MVSEQLRDKKGVYRLFQGIRYNYWPKRKLYVSQKDGKQTMLHRVWWESINGSIPKRYAVVPLNEQWECFEASEWECRPHAGNGRKFQPIHPCIEFNGRPYYKASDCPYYYHTFNDGKKRLLHRDVYEKFHGTIPDKFVVHHQDFDSSNNDSTNLVALSSKDHHKLHSAAKRAGV